MHNGLTLDPRDRDSVSSLACNFHPAFHVFNYDERAEMFHKFGPELCKTRGVT